ncbi:FeoA family protein [Kordiimonas aestuarii]|uniref:FeoA family protein n=1 Tax=Kordiimonas aestuarii TaxID=1005925 RepID=UPI0021D1D83F|nr:FeoA family protein [Kordiimonas aestuarii]
MNHPTPIEDAVLESLGTMRPGARGRIAHFEVSVDEGQDESLTDRLREVGFAENLEVEVLHQSPFGRDPIAVRVGKMTIALRRKEANIVKVHLV